MDGFVCGSWPHNLIWRSIVVCKQLKKKKEQQNHNVENTKKILVIVYNKNFLSVAQQFLLFRNSSPEMEEVIAVISLWSCF